MKGSLSKSGGDNKLKASYDEEAGASIRECEFCGKKFSSGKALGGHKRFHLQAQRKERELANKANNCDGNNGYTKFSPSNSSERFICCLCNKDFPSEKSLFGHMRSHPDRDWRGVHPPTPYDEKHTHSCSPNSDISVEHSDSSGIAATPTGSTIDISKSLPPTWLKTDTRGRESVWAAMVRVLVSLVDESHNGANLQQDGDFDSDKLNGEDEGDGKDEDDNGNDDDDDDDDHEEEEEEEANWIKEEYSLTNTKGALDGMKTEVTTSRLQDHASNIDEGVVKMEESKKRKLIVRFKTHQDSKYEDESVTKILKDGYQCDICDKSFPTFQALGGHRLSHNEKKNKNLTDEQRSSDNIGESSQSHSKSPRNFNLNELPDDMEDEDN